MILTKRKNGRWYIVYNQANGKRTGISTGTKIKTKALKLLSKFEKELENKKSQKTIPISFNSYCNQFLSYSKSVHTVKTQETYIQTINYVKKFFGEIALKDVTALSLTKYFEQRVISGSIYQARKDLICCNSLFNKAIAEGYIYQNPCKDIKRFRLPEKQPLFFTKLEFEKLLSAINETDIKDLVNFALQTGLRQMELITLEWAQISFSDKYLILDNQNNFTKSKKIRSIPLSKKAMKILVERKRVAKGNLIFTLENKPINQDFISRKFKGYVIE
ncbi:MAG: tyrosine-type recombinase/integrase, partial [Melioribacteraceae bacterium]